MSYDFWLDIDTGGHEPATVWDGPNCTSNVSPMWREALGHPLADFDGKLGADIAEPLAVAAKAMETSPTKYEAMNPPNGWGDSAGALRVLRELAEQCAKHPKATLRISR